MIFVADVTTGVTEEDARVAELLRRSKRPVFVVANKVDDRRHEAAMWDLLSLGSRRAVAGLRAARRGHRRPARSWSCCARCRSPDEEDERGRPSATAPSGERRVLGGPVGRPNVGKSTLFNRLIGEDRSVVHDMPGTTRDAIDTVVDTDDGPIRFIDTAGMRRKSRIDEGTEYYSFVRALQSVDTADVALLVIDAGEGVTHQDQRLAERIDAAGCPIVVLLNKWELLDPDSAPTSCPGRPNALLPRRERRPPDLRADRQGVHRLLPALEGAIDQYHRRVPTRRVNDVIRAAQQAQPGPLDTTSGSCSLPTRRTPSR